MDSIGYNDFRGFVEEAKKVSDWRLIEGADWDKEIGALIESTAELPQAPMLVFDRIKDYPPGFRLLSLPYASYKRVALAFGLPTDKSKVEIVRLLAGRIQSAKAIPPVEVKTSPLMENVMESGAVDLFKFPAPRFHDGDGGRYIGTGDCLINADPGGSFINAGTVQNAAPRSEPPRSLDESGAARPAGLHEVLGTGQELSRGCGVQPEPSGLFSGPHQSSVGPFRAGARRRFNGSSARSLEGAARLNDQKVSCRHDDAVGRGTSAGERLGGYWQPVALSRF
jgi:hypothetical protein